MSRTLMHIGVKRRSGRYPWGSGGHRAKREPTFLDRYYELEEKGLSKSELAKALGVRTSDLQKKKSLAIIAEREEAAAFALSLLDKGYSKSAIGRRMDLNESSVRALLNPKLQERARVTRAIVDDLKKQVEEKRYVDIGLGTELAYNTNKNRFETAVYQLEQEGYKVHWIKTPQGRPGQYTSVRVLTKKDVDYKDVYENQGKVRLVDESAEVGSQGRSVLGLRPVNSLNSSRVHIRYAEDGGADKDGLIEIRRGVEELDLGTARYAQVRIGVDGKYFMKGMAVYSDNLPDGVDVVYNVSKKRGTPPDKVFKPMREIDDVSGEIDTDNPFKSTVRQKTYIGKDGKEHVSALNVVNEEGDWSRWSRTISSQVLSKQNPDLAREQLTIAYQSKKNEFDDIMSVTNPVLREHLLESFADKCDTDAVNLKAAAMPRQANRVILPFPDMKPTDVYAPSFQDGERVVLIRHPHGGTFEIPELVVNNRSKSPRSVLGQSEDAIGIHPSIAAKLSGADFDGDTVLVIPNRDGRIRSDAHNNDPAIQAIRNFAPREQYAHYPGMPRMSKPRKEQEMGNATNLIMDMTIRGADFEEISRAVRYSMVVIDAENHYLDYKRAHRDFGITNLKRKYQLEPAGTTGASTLLSRSKSVKYVPHRKDRYGVDPETGRKVFYDDPQEYTVIDKKTKKPRVVKRLTKTTQMYETEDAMTLSSGTRIERVYGEYANRMKALGNRARYERVRVDDHVYSPAARKIYAEELKSLSAQLSVAYRNKPLERNATLIANSQVRAKTQANPNMTPEDKKKLRVQALKEARLRLGGAARNERQVKITDREWEAIQAGAVSKTFLRQILLNTDLDAVKQRAMPRTKLAVPAQKAVRIREMARRGYTQAEIAELLGMGTDTIQSVLNGD